jgi:hypothetical protein
LAQELKYQKRQWLKMTYRLLEVGRSNATYGYAKFYKGKKVVKMSCSIDKMNELNKIPLATRLTVWFDVQTRSFEDKFSKKLNDVTYCSLMYYEKYVKKEVQKQAEHDYSMQINHLLIDRCDVNEIED